MKTVTFVIVALLGYVYASNEYDFNIFQRQINEKCLGRWWTKDNSPNDMKPVGMSLKSFLAMVEKIEYNHTDWDMYRVTKELLKRFAFEEIVFKQLSNERRAIQTNSYKHRWDIISKLLPEDQTEEQFKEDDLSEEEKCTMFFMMGHLINGTYRNQELDGESYVQDVPLEAPFPAEHPVTRTKRAKFPREQGVISIDGSDTQAIAISKVLNAIIASQAESEQPISNIVQDNGKIPRDLKIKPVIGVTLGDVLSLASLYHENGASGARFFGPGGTWNHSGCPTEFTLKANATGATNALLRGAVDGLLISHAIKTWGGSSIRGLKLSRVLRTYYSPKGLPMAHGMKDGVSYCRRQDLSTHIGQNEIQQSVLAYYYMHVWKELTQVFEDSESNVNNAISHMNSALAEMESESKTDECMMNNIQQDRPICETPSNVFVVVDSTDEKTDGFSNQQSIIGQLASKVDFGYGSLSVFLDSPKNQELERVAYEDKNPTCAGCRIAWLDENRYNSQGANEVVMLDALNKTLREFEKVTDLLPGVPNKVAVVFRSKLNQDKNKVNNAANILKNGHRDVRVLVVGDNRGELSVMTRQLEDVITETRLEETVKALKNRICKVPAAFQFNRCWDHKRTTRLEDQNNYIGYVTDNHVQFWAFHPEYYLKSYTVTIKFQVEQSGGDIVVCEQRGADNPGFTQDVLDEKKCQKTDSSNRELIFKIQDPCDGYDVNNCPTMNFAVIGRSGSTNSHSIGCLDEHDIKCRRLDQVKFKVVHDGVSCNGCELLKSSSLLLGFAALFFMIKNTV